MHRGKKLQRCQQGRPSPFVPINVTVTPNCTCVLFPLLVFFVSGRTDFVSYFFLHHATAHTMTMMMMNYNYLSRSICFGTLVFHEFHCTYLISTKMCTLPTTVQCYTIHCSWVTMNIDGYKRGRTTLLTSL